MVPAGFVLLCGGGVGADLSLRFDLHDHPAPQLSGRVGDDDEGKDGVAQVREPPDDALVPPPNTELRDILGDGDAVVLLVDNPRALRGRCFRGDSFGQTSGTGRTIGVGPWPGLWPDGESFGLSRSEILSGLAQVARGSDHFGVLRGAIACRQPRRAFWPTADN